MSFTLSGNELVSVDPVDSTGASGPGRILVTTQAIADLGGGGAPSGLLAFKMNTLSASGNFANTNLPLNANPNTTANSMNCRRICQTPANSGMTDIVVGFAGFGAPGSSPELDLPTAFNIVAASVEYPLGTTPRQVFFAGSATATVNPGRIMVYSDPAPMYIPPGTQFAIKADLTWTPGTFWESLALGSMLTGLDATVVGTGLASHALDNTTLTSTTSNLGYGPIAFGRLATKVPVVGILGDSITAGQQDWADPFCKMLSWGRGLQGQIPSINLSTGGTTIAQFVARPEGRSMIFRDKITHLLFSLGVNDIDGGTSLATMQSLFQSAVFPFLAAGIKVHATTITPNTTSTDNFMSAANQTPVSAPNDVTRQAYNSWLRNNWQALGLSGIFDAARAVDPTDSGKWGFDIGAGAVSTATDAALFATALTGGAVTTVAPSASAMFQGGPSVGTAYGNAQTVNWTSYPYLGDPGSGASGTFISNSAGNLVVGGATISNAGAGYVLAPMINLLGRWTTGLHPTPRGYNEIIHRTGFGPGAFTL